MTTTTDTVDLVCEYVVSMPQGVETTARMVAGALNLTLEDTRSALTWLVDNHVAMLRCEQLRLAPGQPKKERHWYARAFNVAGCHVPDCALPAWLKARCRCMRATSVYVCAAGHTTRWQGNQNCGHHA